jgi:undecaprenyl phosphate N,N'-diacetylbacillosamine 1-phosphate transferase
MTRTQEFVKRLIDIIIAELALVMLSPVLLLIALAIRLDSTGEVLFRQKRTGRGGRPFTLFKFRTMFVDSPDLRNSDGSTYNGREDARVTRVGRFLRTTSLDELPQLFNVLAGDMSLVGPRPDLVDQTSYYGPDQWRRLIVRPGITGLAQINGRNGIPWADRTLLDLEYVSNLSLQKDGQILWRTVGYVLARRDIFVTHTRSTAR